MKNIFKITIVIFLYIFLLTGIFENFINSSSDTWLIVAGVVIVILLTAFLVKFITSATDK